MTHIVSDVSIGAQGEEQAMIHLLASGRIQIIFECICVAIFEIREEILTPHFVTLFSAALNAVLSFQGSPGQIEVQHMKELSGFSL